MALVFFISLLWLLGKGESFSLKNTASEMGFHRIAISAFLVMSISIFSKEDVATLFANFPALFVFFLAALSSTAPKQLGE